MNDMMSHYENVFGEYELEIICKGFELGLKPDQISLYARPDFCGEKMEVILEGIQSGLSYAKQEDFT